MTAERTTLAAAWRRHERQWADHLYVYAVVSRRSRGLSIGLNLNPDKGCNFDCVYCQVDRREPPRVRRVDLERLRAELDAVLGAARDGWLYDRAPFDALPPEARQVRDLAFSGDGEPTAAPAFPEAVALAADARRRFALDASKIVLITDAAYLSRPRVREALTILDRNNGEIWAKLDAGTEEYFRLIDRPNVPFQVILDNLLEAGRARPVVIQSLFLRVNGAGPPDAEIDAYIARLEDLLAGGGRIKEVQVYTVARRPAEPFVTALPASELDGLAARVRTRLPVPVEVFYGGE